jgi:hypothetical protein
MISFKKKPQFNKTFKRLNDIKKFDAFPILQKWGKIGVANLASATPKDSGDASNSWNYKIEGDKTRYKLIWTNSEIAGSVPLVILLQYGHATKSGYFLSGRDFINPALRPVYDGILKDVSREAFA